jgi:4-azaleucine resistance transporter AzlC
MKHTQLSQFFSGVKAELPLLVGVIPFGMIYGVLALSAGIPPGAAQAMSSLVFAGSAQFVSTQLVGKGVPTLVIILTVLVVNLRHALYSASVAPYLRQLRPFWKGLLAYLLTDEAYAVTIIHYQKGNNPTSSAEERHWFFLGAGLTLWAAWQASTAAGIFIGAQIPPSWSLDFTLALTFIALMVPNLKDSAAVAAALVAGVMAVIAFALPYKLGLMLAALAGILTGLLMERKTWKSGG